MEVVDHINEHLFKFTLIAWWKNKGKQKIRKV